MRMEKSGDVCVKRRFSTEGYTKSVWQPFLSSKLVLASATTKFELSTTCICDDSRMLQSSFLEVVEGWYFEVLLRSTVVTLDGLSNVLTIVFIHCCWFLMEIDDHWSYLTTQHSCSMYCSNRHGRWLRWLWGVRLVLRTPPMNMMHLTGTPMMIEKKAAGKCCTPTSTS